MARDDDRRALLLERLRPGQPLSEVEDDDAATRIGAAVRRRIWRPAPQSHLFLTLRAEAAHWADELPAAYEAQGRPFDRALLDEAVAACRELARSQAEAYLLHQDLHAGNILSAEREPWLAIDPKPIVGERAFDVAALLRDRPELLAGPSGGAVVRRRLDMLVDELGLDRERMRLWGLAHTLAWSLDETTRRFDPRMVHAARLLSEA